MIVDIQRLVEDQAAVAQGVAEGVALSATLQAQGHDLTGLSILITGDEELGSAISRQLLLD